MALQAQTPNGTLIQSFTIKEFFGVAHPNQIFDFDFAGSVDWTKAYMLGPAGNEVPYQVCQNFLKMSPLKLRRKCPRWFT